MQLREMGSRWRDREDSLFFYTQTNSLVHIDTHTHALTHTQTSRNQGTHTHTHVPPATYTSILYKSNHIYEP